MFQVISKSKFRNEVFVLATFATIQEANSCMLKANARNTGNTYRVVAAA